MSVSLETFEARLDALVGEAEVVINWDIALDALGAARGIPVMIGLELLPEESNQGDVVPAVDG